MNERKKPSRRFGPRRWIQLLVAVAFFLFGLNTLWPALGESRYSLVPETGQREGQAMTDTAFQSFAGPDEERFLSREPLGPRPKPPEQPGFFEVAGAALERSLGGPVRWIVRHGYDTDYNYNFMRLPREERDALLDGLPGEAFGAILSAVSLEHAHVIAEQQRRIVRNYNILRRTGGGLIPHMAFALAACLALGAVVPVMYRPLAVATIRRGMGFWGFAKRIAGGTSEHVRGLADEAKDGRAANHAGDDEEGESPDAEGVEPR